MGFTRATRTLRKPRATVAQLALKCRKRQRDSEPEPLADAVLYKILSAAGPTRELPFPDPVLQRSVLVVLERPGLSMRLRLPAGHEGPGLSMRLRLYELWDGRLLSTLDTGGDVTMEMFTDSQVVSAGNTVITVGEGVDTAASNRAMDLRGSTWRAIPACGEEEEEEEDEAVEEQWWVLTDVASGNVVRATAEAAEGHHRKTDILLTPHMRWRRLPDLPLGDAVDCVFLWRRRIFYLCATWRSLGVWDPTPASEHVEVDHQAFADSLTRLREVVLTQHSHRLSNVQFAEARDGILYAVVWTCGLRIVVLYLVEAEYSWRVVMQLPMREGTWSNLGPKVWALGGGHLLILAECEYSEESEFWVINHRGCYRMGSVSAADRHWWGVPNLESERIVLVENLEFLP